jgi:type II secretory pathway pseudopilin PulG
MKTANPDSSPHQAPRPRVASRGNHRAYTLAEVLIALGIFAIGFVSIAAIFPVASIMQKATVQDMTAQQFERSVTAALQGRPFVWHPDPVNSLDDITTYFPAAFLPQDTNIHPILQPGLSPTGNLHANGPRVWERWKLNDRSYFMETKGTGGYYPILTSEVATMIFTPTAFRRTYYWVPLMRRITATGTEADDMLTSRGSGSPPVL